MQTCNESLNQPGFKLNPNLFVATRIQRRLQSALYPATFRTSSSPATFASVRTPITAIAASLDPTASSTTRGASRSSRLSQGNSSRRGHTSLRPQVSVYCSSLMHFVQLFDSYLGFTQPHAYLSLEFESFHFCSRTSIHSLYRIDCFPR